MQSKGRSVPNQFEIIADGITLFQSYDSVIAKMLPCGQVHLDSVYWNYSRTTSKYRSQFLGESTKDTEKKIKSGQYILTNLN